MPITYFSNRSHLHPLRRSSVPLVFAVCQTYRESLSLDTYQPPVQWMIDVSQPNANLVTGIVQAEGCLSVTNCIGPAETGASAVTIKRTSPGFYTLAAGGKSGPSELYAIISTDVYEYDDVTAATGATLGRSSLRGSKNVCAQQGIPCDVFINGLESLQTNLMFGTLGISVNGVILDQTCSDDDPCTGQLGTLNDKVRNTTISTSVLMHLKLISCVRPVKVNCHLSTIFQLVVASC